MNFREKLKQTACWVLMGAMLSVFTLDAQAACTFFDEFQDNKDGTVTDPRSGAVWKRCAEGFEWKGSSCVGSAKPVNWFEAMKIARKDRFLNARDWRLPTKNELARVVGRAADCGSNNYKNGEYAVSNMIAHAIRDDSNPGSFWSSTPGDKDDGAVFVFFGNGNFCSRWPQRPFSSAICSFRQVLE